MVNMTGSIKNIASVSGNEFDVDKSNNQASSSVNVPLATDLAVAKVVNNSAPNYGSLVKWTVTVKNNGPDVAHDIVLTDVLPSGLIIKSVTGNYIDGRWTIGALNIGDYRSFEIITQVNKTGSLINHISVVGKEYDYNFANNNASEAINVAKAADLAVTKMVNNSSPNYLDLVKWTVVVRNNGPDVASGVRVSDVLPAGLVYLSSSASVGSFADGVWNVGKLAKGASATLTIVTMVNKVLLRMLCLFLVMSLMLISLIIRLLVLLMLIRLLIWLLLKWLIIVLLIMVVWLSGLCLLKIMVRMLLMILS